jgi:exosome complex component RRP4
MGIGDAIACKIYSVKRKGVDVTIKGRGLGKLEDGLIIKINSNKVPRVIGKEGTMINLIKEKTGCNIIVGQNGVVWISGRDIEEELKAKEAILFITEKSFVDGLTEQVKSFLEKK